MCLLCVALYGQSMQLRIKKVDVIGIGEATHVVCAGTHLLEEFLSDILDEQALLFQEAIHVTLILKKLELQCRHCLRNFIVVLALTDKPLDHIDSSDLTTNQEELGWDLVAIFRAVFEVRLLASFNHVIVPELHHSVQLPQVVEDF